MEKFGKESMKHEMVEKKVTKKPFGKKPSELAKKLINRKKMC